MLTAPGQAYFRLVAYALDSGISGDLKQDMLKRVEMSNTPINPIGEMDGAKAIQIASGFSKILSDPASLEAVKSDWIHIQAVIDELTQRLTVEASDRAEKEKETAILVSPQVTASIPRSYDRILAAEALHQTSDGRIFSVTIDHPQNKKFIVNLIEHVGDKLEMRSSLPVDGYKSSDPKWHVDSQGRSLLTFGTNQGEIYLYEIKDGKLRKVDMVRSSQIVTSRLVGYNTKNGETHFAAAAQHSMYIFKLKGNRLRQVGKSKFEQSREDLEDPIWVADRKGNLFVVSKLMWHSPAIFKFDPSPVRFPWSFFASKLTPVDTQLLGSDYKDFQMYVDSDGTEIFSMIGNEKRLWVGRIEDNQIHIVEEFDLGSVWWKKHRWMRSPEGRNFIAVATIGNQFLKVLEFKNGRFHLIADEHVSSWLSEIYETAYPSWHVAKNGRIFLALSCLKTSVCIYELIKEQELRKISTLTQIEEIPYPIHWAEYENGEIYISVVGRSGSLYKISLLRNLMKKKARN